MLIAHISDLHVSSGGVSSCGSQPSSNDLLARVISDICAFRPAIDAVAITGDLTELGTAEEYRLVKRLLSPLPMPIFMVPGNHDRRNAMRAAFGTTQPFDPNQPWLQYAVVYGGVRIIALDTITEDKPEGSLCKGRLEWLEQVLRQVPAMETLILMHHPPVRTGMTFMDRIGLLDGVEGLAGILRRHPPARRIFCGHVHRPMNVAWGDTTVFVGGSPTLQIELQIGHDHPRPVHEPYRYFIHHYIERNVVTHSRYLS